jgi:IS30 family transposase
MHYGFCASFVLCSSRSRRFLDIPSCFELTDNQIDEVMDKLSHRPWKTLNYQTQNAVFFKDIQQNAT